MAYTQFNGWNIIPMPASPAPRSMTFSMNDSVGVTQSPFTMQSQTQAWPGADWWDVEVSLPPMNRATAADWVGWLMAMRGKQNVCMVGDPTATQSLGVGSASPLVSGAQLATATSITTKGWTNPTTLNLLPDTDLVGATWTQPGPGASIAPQAGAISGNAAMAYGTGQVVSVTALQLAVTLIVNQTYVLSCYTDARNVISGTMGIQAFSSGGLNVTASIPNGTSGRASLVFTCPSGSTSASIILGGWSITAKRGYPAFWSNPMVQFGNTLTPYISPSVLSPGDYLQLGNRLHAVAGSSGVYPDGSGNATVEIWPSVREALTDGQAINLVNPRGLFRLADNKRSWSVSEAKMYGISFKLVEAR